MDIYKKALIENTALAEEITEINKRLAMLPEGTLEVHKNGPAKGYKWYLRETDKEDGNRKRTYIHKAQRDYAEKLAERTILTCRLKEAKKKQSAIRGFLKHYPIENAEKKLCKKSPGFLELLPHIQTDNESLKAWQDHPYEMNPYRTETKTIRTLRGEMVRSKAEAMIVNTLFQRGIAYRYDCALYLGDSVVYPDILMIRPGVPVPPLDHRFTERDRDIILIVEHNGLMDKSRYRDHVKNKIGLYYDHGFIPSKNLIMTYETSDEPFDLSYFIRELDYYYV